MTFFLSTETFTTNGWPGVR